MILITDKRLIPALSDFVARLGDALAASRAEEEKREDGEEKAAWLESLNPKENFSYDSESGLKPGNELDDGSRLDMLQREYSDCAADTLLSSYRTTRRRLILLLEILYISISKCRQAGSII